MSEQPSAWHVTHSNCVRCLPMDDQVGGNASQVFPRRLLATFIADGQLLLYPLDTCIRRDCAKLQHLVVLARSVHRMLIRCAMP